MLGLPRSRRCCISLALPLLVLTSLSLGWILFHADVSHLRQRLQPPTLAPLNETVIQNLVKQITPSPTFAPEVSTFWNEVQNALIEARPTCMLPDKEIEAPKHKVGTFGLGFKKRPDLIELSRQDVEVMRKAHALFVEQLPQLAPKLPFTHGSKGIVMTTDVDDMPLVLISIRMLRKTGTILPVEVYMESQAVYETELCEDVFPRLNATCLLLSDILDGGPQKVKISKNQLGAFAILFSSFEDILLLDANNLVTERPDNLFSAEPFLSRGLVLWPDYYTRTTSPKYNLITSQPSSNTHPTTSSAQVLLSKRTHATTLLLILYYNYYGPTHYHPLLTQNATTTPYKETYLAAANVLKTPFYTVTGVPEELGHHGNKDKKWRPCGAVARNPEDDFRIHIKDHDHKSLLRSNSSSTAAGVEPRRSFLHAQTYRMDPVGIVNVFNNQLKIRMWGPHEEMVAKFGRDVEMQLWAEVMFVGCTFEGRLKAWGNKTHVCSDIARVYKFLWP